MNVLIVEDDDNKLREIRTFVLALQGVRQVAVAHSLHSARRALKEDAYELVILDMTLPNYDVTVDEPGGGSVHSFGGEKLLRYLDRLELATPVIVVTQFELFIGDTGPMDIGQLHNRLVERFRSNYCGMVYYHASLSRWRVDLAALVTHVSAGRHDSGEVS